MPAVRRWIFAAALAAGAAGCEEPPTQADAPPRVATRALGELLIDYTHRVPADAVSLNDSRLAAEIRAPVAALPGRIGEVVAAGDPVVRLDCGDAEDRLAQARARLDARQAGARLARLQFERAQRLRRQNAIAEEDLNLRESEWQAAAAEKRAQAAAVALAQRNVAKCTVRAPFEAAVRAHHVQVGEMVSPGTPVARVVDLDRMEVSAELTRAEARSLARAANPRLAVGESRYPLALRTITPAVDPVKRTREARLRFQQARPLPGASGELVWTDPRPALPAGLLSRRDGRLGVLLARDGAVAFHPLPGAREGRPALLALDDGLTRDSRVITEGRLGLAPGEAIRTDG